MSLTTRPWTSVNRKSRPAWGYCNRCSDPVRAEQSAPLPLLSLALLSRQKGNQALNRNGRYPTRRDDRECSKGDSTTAASARTHFAAAKNCRRRSGRTFLVVRKLMDQTTRSAFAEEESSLVRLRRIIAVALFQSKARLVQRIEVLGGSGLGVSTLNAITVVTQIVLASWFAFLIGYQERRCSPTRLFLEGLIFPGVAASLISGPAFTILFGLECQR